MIEKDYERLESAVKTGATLCRFIVSQHEELTPLAYKHKPEHMTNSEFYAPLAGKMTRCVYNVFAVLDDPLYEDDQSRPREDCTRAGFFYEPGNEHQYAVMVEAGHPSYEAALKRVSELHQRYSCRGPIVTDRLYFVDDVSNYRLRWIRRRASTPEREDVILDNI
jgi:hypothetical protein